MEIFVKDFSRTTSPRVLKFCIDIRYDRLYCVLKKQPHMAYQSFYLSIFLSFQHFYEVYRGYIVILPVYEVYRGYIVFAFSVCV